MIDEVAIYDRALSSEQVQDIHLNGLNKHGLLVNFSGDYHLRSQAGRWSASNYSRLDPTADGFIDLTDFAAFADYWQLTGSPLPADLDNSGTVDFNDLWMLLENYLNTYEAGAWVYDDVTSGAIDAGNPGCPLLDEPNDPNNLRLNMGAYAGTAEASRTPPDWALLADITNDLIVDHNDLSVFVDYWLETGPCLPSDFNRSTFTDFADFALFAEDWLIQLQW
jgi:hypothetical protein